VATAVCNDRIQVPSRDSWAQVPKQFCVFAHGTSTRVGIGDVPGLPKRIGPRPAGRRANAISTSSSRTIGPSTMASGSGASVSNGRASSGCPRSKSGRTGAPHRKWSDGSPICLGSWRGVRTIPSGREPSISVTPSSVSTEQPAGDDRARRFVNINLRRGSTPDVRT
jgi:hypothetical protein